MSSKTFENRTREVDHPRYSMVSFRLDERENRLLEAHARKTGQTKSAVMRQAVESMLTANKK